ncbi:TetR family transcriptional regulator [Myceligenerans indicum]|uniref:TetR family transcriptional regulator n=1 Tax=Myceligenerans indicum TaxID=2593663 RepID=A0ABS1LQZ4_9MICO|nr:TetR family transcriptional regulator [Myceligenerans indicum]MBL0888629.1 TetR family transcriptional regulator [Myceligenerans indicum]
MGRASQAQAQENRQRVIETASRLFRESGTEVSVADLMKAAGLTHGGFYKQFTSKGALIAEAAAHAFDEQTRLRAAVLEQHPGHRDDAQREVIDAYLSPEHRDRAADGCPIAGLAVDVARGHGSPEARQVFAEQVEATAEWLATKDDDGLTRLATMVGALILARATKDAPISENFLTAARKAL